MSDLPQEDLPLGSIDWSNWPRAPDRLRAELLRATSRVVARRARRRRWRVAASWGVAYAAGIATAWLAWPDASAPHVANPQLPTPPPIATKLAPSPADDEEPSPLNLESLSPEQLRSRVAGAARPEQIYLLRLAGDRYLFGAADVVSALDCYRQVIELTPRKDLTKAQPDDSWLLAELKLSAAGGEE
jgi:hypothetical protein